MHISMETMYQKVKQNLLNTLLCFDAVYCKSCVCHVQNASVVHSQNGQSPQIASMGVNSNDQLTTDTVFCWGNHGYRRSSAPASLQTIHTPSWKEAKQDNACCQITKAAHKCNVTMGLKYQLAPKVSECEDKDRHHCELFPTHIPWHTPNLSFSCCCYLLLIPHVIAENHAI